MRTQLQILSLIVLGIFAVLLPAQETEKPKDEKTENAAVAVVRDYVIPKTAAEAAEVLKKVTKLRADLPNADESKKDLRDAYDAQINKLTELLKAFTDLENFDAELQRLQDEKEAVVKAARELPVPETPYYHPRNVTEKMEAEATQLLNSLQQEKATATTILENKRSAKTGLPDEIAKLSVSIASKGAEEAAALEALKEATVTGGGDVIILEEKLYLTRLDKEIFLQRKALAERELATDRRQLQESIAELQEGIAKRKLSAQQDIRDAIKKALTTKIGTEGERLINELERFRGTKEGSPNYVYYDFKLEAAKARREGNNAKAGETSLNMELADSGDFEVLKLDAEELKKWIDDERKGEGLSEGLLPDSAKDIRDYLRASQGRYQGASDAIKILRDAITKLKKTRATLTSKQTRAQGRVRFAQEEAKDFKGSDDVPKPEDWQALIPELEAAYKAAITSVVERVESVEALQKKWGDLKDTADGNIAFLKQRLRWTQEKNNISLESIKDAFRDGTDAVETAPSTLVSLGPKAVQYIKDPRRRVRVIVVAVLFLALGFLFWRLRKRLPTTYHWIEEQSKEGNQFFKVLGIFLRRTDLSLLLALLFIGATWAAGMGWTVVATMLCTFGALFLYRLGRVILDVFFQPGSNDIRFFDMDEKLAEIIHRAGRWMLNLAIFFLPLSYLLQIYGYDDSNQGFVDLWDLIHRTLTQLVLLFSIFRPLVVRTLIRGQNIVAVSLKAWILLGYPLLVGSTLYIFLLGSLRYSEAKSFFQLLLLKTVALLLGSYVLYRVALRALLKSREMDKRILQDEFESEDAYLMAGRLQFADRLVRTVLRFAFVIPVIVILSRFWEEVSFEWAHASLDGNEGISFTDVLLSVFVLFLTMVFVSKLRGALSFVILPATKLDRGLRYTVIMLMTYGIWTIGLVIALPIIGISGDNIAFFTGALAFGIGFGLQSIVKNFVSGLILLVERPVKVGDMVEVESRSGTVDKITLRATTVMTYDGIGVVIPNELMIGGSLTNYSLGHPRLRSTLAVGVGYGSDVQKVRKILNEVVSNYGLILKRPEPEAFFVGFGDSSLDFQILFWTSMTTHRPRTLSDLRFALNAAFRRENIEIPFPQRDLNIRTVDGTVVAAFGGAKLPQKGDGGALDIDDANRQDNPRKDDSK